MSREKLGSRLGFILLSAGCAIGIGNVWKFPYIVGQNGGGLFVIIYLVFLAILGIPVLTMEFSVGRAAQRSPVKMYQQLEPKGTKWHIHGVAAMVGSYILLMFYTTVAGWMLWYFFSTAGGALSGLDAAGISGHFDSVLANAPMMILFVAIVLAAAVLICSIGLRNGLERVTKVMMLALLAIMVILAINSFFMEGGEAGLAFYLRPNVEEIQKVGIGNVIVSAMNQAFFTLSLGMGGMAIFGSYIGKDRSLLGESVNVALLDTFVAFSSGLIIFPACFAYGVDVEQPCQPYLPDAPEHIQPHSPRASVGEPVLRIHVVRRAVHRACGFRGDHRLRRGPHGLGQEEMLHFQRTAAVRAFRTLLPWIQRAERIPAAGRGYQYHGHRGLHRKQPGASSGLACAYPVLHNEKGLGLG